MRRSAVPSANDDEHAYRARARARALLAAVESGAPERAAKAHDLASLVLRGGRDEDAPDEPSRKAG